MFHRGAEPPPISRLRARVWFAVVLAFGVTAMLLVVAVGMADESSNEPWVAGEAVFYGAPVLIALVGYRLLRRRSASPRKALLLSLAMFPGTLLALAAVIAAIWLLAG